MPRKLHLLRGAWSSARRAVLKGVKTIKVVPALPKSEGSAIEYVDRRGLIIATSYLLKELNELDSHEPDGAAWQLAKRNALATHPVVEGPAFYAKKRGGFGLVENRLVESSCCDKPGKLVEFRSVLLGQSRAVVVRMRLVHARNKADPRNLSL